MDEWLTGTRRDSAHGLVNIMETNVENMHYRTGKRLWLHASALSTTARDRITVFSPLNSYARVTVTVKRLETVVS